jgi:hypothetical protein
LIFYGKASQPLATAAALAEIEDRIAEATSAPLPILRHAAWVAALVAAGELSQGLADAGSEAGEAGALALATALAGLMGASWDSGFAALPARVPPNVASALAGLRADRARWPVSVEARRTEGFAHYATYPEGFWAAARGLAGPRPGRVLGIRSIGSTLAPSVAAALGAGDPVTVRPQGHPFARVVEPGPWAAAAMREGADAVWAIVDEGPGLSGSSFGAAADALGRAGVAPERLVLFPSHAGTPGAMASDAHRGLWRRARSAVLSFEDLWLAGARPGTALQDWVADLTGPLLQPPEDVAGGRWRALQTTDDSAWPAVDRQNERRKVLLRGRDTDVLLRFAGLGAFGRAKADRARDLAEAGFCLAPLAWRHGLLVEPWRHDLTPLTARDLRRPAMQDRLADYLAFRARRFPALPGTGACPAALLAMARANAAEVLGEAAARAVARWTDRLPALAAAARPVAIDGRLAPHEWLQDRAGRVVKTDALDHCCGHDLVGCQDIAWDVAGAAAEWDLDEDEVEALRREVERRSGSACHAELVAFFGLAYPAFRIGALALARGREAGAEADRLSAALATMTARLARALG